MITRPFNRVCLLIGALALAVIISTAFFIPDVVTALGAAGHALQASLPTPAGAGTALLCVGPLMMRFQVREGFVATTYTRAELGEGRTELRTNNFFGGETAEFSAADADANLQKLEPKDQAATDYMNSKHAVAEQPVSPATIDAIVAKAVAEGIASFMAGMQAANAATAAAAVAVGAKAA